jgi:hypothetical protein
MTRLLAKMGRQYAITYQQIRDRALEPSVIVDCPREKKPAPPCQEITRFPRHRAEPQLLGGPRETPPPSGWLVVSENWAAGSLKRLAGEVSRDLRLPPVSIPTLSAGRRPSTTDRRAAFRPVRDDGDHSGYVAIAGHQHVTFCLAKCYEETTWELRWAWMGLECAILPPICHQSQTSSSPKAYVSVKESPSSIVGPTPLPDQVARHGKQDRQDRCRVGVVARTSHRTVPEFGGFSVHPKKRRL